MSNTSSVSPYENSSDPGILAKGGTSVIQWLSENTAADQTAVARLQEDRRKDRLKRMPSCCFPGSQGSPVRLTTTGLHLRNPESLVQSANKLGYHVVPLSSPSPLENDTVFLQNPAGDRLAIERSPAGNLIVHTGSDQRVVQSLVQQHSVDQVLHYLNRKKMQVQQAHLANGEFQILAREPQTGQRDGSAEVKAQIHLDGRAWVDIEGVRGKRCEQIVGELAVAMGAQVSSCKKKDAYYQLPGEPVKTRQQI